MTAAIFINLHKAFDTTDNLIMLAKLKHMELEMKPLIGLRVTSVDVNNEHWFMDPFQTLQIFPMGSCRAKFWALCYF